jgi:hypothetical protein
MKLMWQMAVNGFVSLVEKESDVGNDTLTVRARDKESLAAFAGVNVNTIQFAMATDYPYRLVMKREDAAQRAYDEVMGIHYDNFKNAAKATRGQRYASVLSKVWHDMLGLETAKTRKEINKRHQSSLVQGNGYGSLFSQGDDWKGILADQQEPVDADRMQELEDIVLELGVHGLTDEQYAEWEKGQ